MRKQLAAVGLTAGLAVGGVAGFAFTSGTAAVGAQSDTTTTTTTTSAPTPRPKGERPDPTARLQKTLKPLVDDGTITQVQADKVVETLIAAKPAKPDRGGRRGPGGFVMREGLDTVAKALGVTRDELKADLQKGESIAAIAKAKGIDLSKVTDALVGEATARVDAQVTKGKITQAQADKRIAALKDRITAMVKGELPSGGPGAGPGGRTGGWGHGPRGSHGPDQAPPAETPPADAPSSSAPTTTAG